MAAYVVVLLLSRWMLDDHIATQWVLPMSIAPIVPIAFATWAIIRAHRRMDELEQKIQLEALGFAFTGTTLACVAYGFLEESIVPPLNGFAVFTLMMVLKVIGTLIAKRHYK